MDPYEVSSVFDNVKFEKSKAIARFNRFRKITRILQVLEVLMAVILISWSSTKLPTAVRLSGNFLFELAGYIFNPHVVFLIGNAIIVALFVLCRENDAGRLNSGSGDIYEDYVRHSQTQQPKVSVSERDNKTSSAPPSDKKEPTIASVVTDSGDETKQIVCVRSERKAEQCAAVATAIEDATKQIQRFQRTQSAKLKRDISTMKPKAELRRSETVTERNGLMEKQVLMEKSSFHSMDNLSIEEFNLTVDNFIRRMKTPEFLKMQKLDENHELKNLTKITRNSAVLQY